MFAGRWSAAVLASLTVIGGAVLAQGLDPEAVREDALSRTDSLKTVPAPDAPNHTTFVQNRRALRLLGKALFWDQQVGSDGQACASCHFHAGADNRSKNMLNPGFRNQTPGVDVNAFSTELGFGPNYQLTPADYPFHKLSDINDQASAVISDTNDVTSSQGVFNAGFTAIGIPGDIGTPNLNGPGAVFNVLGVLVRNVEPRNTPTVINAVLNHRNFWDSRARNEFNGVDPIGQLDPNAKVVRVHFNHAGEVVKTALIRVRIRDSSAASQADGPPLSNLEMSFDGRRFPEVGRKMEDPSLIALGEQLVATDDSLLGPYSNQNFSSGLKGITLKYSDLIKQAFKRNWWDAPGWVVDIGGPAPVLVKADAPVGPNQFTVLEYNFSLYFGMAINEYEKLLIINDSPFDRFLEGDLTALTDQQVLGLDVFLKKGKCINCHSGPELTGASLTNVQNFEILERMIMGNDEVAVYDNGHYNTGVRPTLEDIGIGATIGPRNLPLSNSRFFQKEVKERVNRIRREHPGIDLEVAIRQANQELEVPRIVARPDEAAVLIAKAADLLANPQSVIDLLADAEAHLLAVPHEPLAASEALVQAREILAGLAHGTAVDAQVAFLLKQATSLLPDPINPGDDPLVPLGPPLRPNERIAVDGAHKTPTVRGTELTAPYFHNGGVTTLEQVVDFYNRGGDFARENEDNLDIDILPLFLTDDEKAGLVAFMKSTTDNRAKFEMAPFDRPSINVPNGGSGVISLLFGVSVMDDRIEVPAVGAGGNGVGLGIAGSPYANFLDPLSP